MVEVNKEQHLAQTHYQGMCDYLDYDVLFKKGKVMAKRKTDKKLSNSKLILFECIAAIVILTMCIGYDYYMAKKHQHLYCKGSAPSSEIVIVDEHGTTSDTQGVFWFRFLDYPECKK